MNPQLLGSYSDVFDEFDCEILACSVARDWYLIRNLDTNETGWCSSHLVDDSIFDSLY